MKHPFAPGDLVVFVGIDGYVNNTPLKIGQNCIIKEASVEPLDFGPPVEVVRVFEKPYEPDCWSRAAAFRLRDFPPPEKISKFSEEPKPKLRAPKLKALMDKLDAYNDGGHR